MTHILEPDKKLISPEYWGGVDIKDASQFNREMPAPSYLSIQEQAAADLVLATCLGEVMHGNFAETPYWPDENFNPSEGELGDGTVIIVDSESLMRRSYAPGQDREWPERHEPTGTRLGTTDFCDIWKSHQPVDSETPIFGEEQASFPAEKIMYDRALQWGVLVTQKSKRLVSTCGFELPRVRSNRVFMPSRRDKMLRRADAMPIPFQKTTTSPELHLDDSSIRGMNRVRGIHIVHAATADYDPKKGREKLSRRFRNALGV
ncbi:MAG TPA: hypothetical protein VD947_01835 [Patescibacteria group bacterium]|nr:hypothetical protein [Patescibacteria group bacterium]